MSLAAQTAVSLARALVIGLAAVAISAWLSHSLRGLRGRPQTIAWALLLAPFLTPSLLISYALSKLALALVSSPWRHEALYLGVLLLKLVPVAAIVRLLVPTPLSAEARHCHTLLAAPSAWARISFRLRAAGPAPWIAGGLVFLLAFADFELASLWSIKAWTVALFDAQTGGLALAESLRLAALPLAVEVAVLGFLLVAGKRSSASAASGRRSSSRGGFIYVTCAALLTTALPLFAVSVQALTGIRAIVENFVLGDELVASVVFAFAAAASATFLSRKMHRQLGPGIPGLLGALVVSLLILALFQMPVLRAAYDTPLPLLCALIILLLPLALLLGALVPQRTPALHIAQQCRSRRLAWELALQPRLAAFGLLFCWAYFDFTASSILAPIGLTPVFVRLHNLAHYGQTAVLSAMMLAAFATPIALLLLTAAAGRIYARSDGR